MAVMVFRLNGVPDDEAEDIRQLMAEHQFDVYETQPGFFGIGLAAIWLKDEDQFSAVRAVIDEYQQQRSQRLSEEHKQMVVDGQAPTLLSRFRSAPITVVLYLIAAVIILALSIKPFFSLH